MARLPLEYLDGPLHIFPERLQSAIYQWFAKDAWDILYQGWYGKRIVDCLQNLGCGRSSAGVRT
jgi:hypothetical protein